MYKYTLIIIVIILLFILWFYRKPANIYLLNNYNKIYSPAYGRIIKIQKFNNNRIHIAIFLSPLDIHRQYIPINGRIKKIIKDYNGKYNIAYNEGKSRDNEKIITIMDTNYGELYIYQIAGFYVRRISNYMKVNDNVITGNELGMIHFGSRVDLIIPNGNLFTINVNEGDYMNGINSIIGYYNK
jgi:phosphatidylserine decarboxylase